MLHRTHLEMQAVTCGTDHCYTKLFILRKMLLACFEVPSWFILVPLEKCIVWQTLKFLLSHIHLLKVTDVSLEISTKCCIWDRFLPVYLSPTPWRI